MPRRIDILLIAVCLATFAGFTASAIADDAADAGFKEFFNGKDLTGWETKQGVSLEGKSESPEKRFKVQEGMLVIDPKEKGDVIIQTAKPFEGDVVLQFEYLPGPACNNDLFFRGIKFDIKPGGVKNLKAGEWNQFEITVKGDRAEFKSNGETQHVATAKGTGSPLGIRAEFGAIQFRKLRAKTGP